MLPRPARVRYRRSGRGIRPVPRAARRALTGDPYARRIFASLTEEVEAINWYEQRLSIEEDAEARAIIEDAR